MRSTPDAMEGVLGCQLIGSQVAVNIFDHDDGRIDNDAEVDRSK
jgi:hypothetical protein